MPQPKNAFSSAGFCARRSAVTLLPATERLAYAVKEPRSAPKLRTNCGSPW